MTHEKDKMLEEAIKKAIEGGVFGNFEKIKNFNWFIGEGDDADLIFFDNGSAGIKVSLHKTFLRPEFWQALGEAEGWENKMCLNCGAVNMTICCDGAKVDGWQWH